MIMSKIPSNTATETIIYSLLCPINYQIRYVGKTVTSLEKRLRTHISDSKNRKQSTHKFCWIRSLSRLGLKPIIREIETCSWIDSSNREIYWIKFFRDKGYNLLNHTDGGEGTLGFKRSQETKDRMSKIMTEMVGVTVSQYDLAGNYIKTFSSLAEAEMESGCTKTKICAVCRGRRKMTGGFMWRYGKLEEVQPYIRTGHTKGKKLPKHIRDIIVKNLKGYGVKFV